MTIILVIEDNEQNMYLISFMLEKHDFKVIKAMNGKDGLKLAIENKPDLIIMDWQLPDINGLDVTRELRKREEFNQIPIVFCTSNAMSGDREKAFNAGATGYIEKPINPDTFIDEIRSYIK